MILPRESSPAPGQGFPTATYPDHETTNGVEYPDPSTFRTFGYPLTPVSPPYVPPTP